MAAAMQYGVKRKWIKESENLNQTTSNVITLQTLNNIEDINKFDSVVSSKEPNKKIITLTDEDDKQVFYHFLWDMIGEKSHINA